MDVIYYVTGFLWVVYICFMTTTGKCTDTVICPAECQCSGLGVVNCHGLGLENIPDLPLKTTSLILTGNRISAISQDDVAGCDVLQSVDFSDNRIRRIENATFESLSQLQQLYLNDNKINLTDRNGLPVGILEPLQDLLELRIHNNIWNDSVQYREDLLIMKPKLRTLTLDSPRENPNLPKVFSQLESLRKLQIHGGLTMLRNKTLQTLENVTVEEVSLLSGKLEGLESTSLRHLRSMASLDLSHNNKLGFGPNVTQAWPGLKHTNIKKLILRNVVPNVGTMSIELPKDFIVNLNATRLQELYLDYNGLFRIEGSLARNLPYLQKLSLSFNIFSTYIIPLSIDFYQMKELHFVDISHHYQFPGLSSAAHGHLSASTPRPVNIFLPPTLSVLNVSETFAVAHFDVIKIVLHTLSVHVDVLDFSQNAFSALRQPIRIQPPHEMHIKLLNISTCLMKYMADDIFPFDLLLDTIDLSYNNMGDYIASVVNGSMLRQFNSAQLKELILSKTGIKDIPDTFFSAIFSLERIHLDGNALLSWKAPLHHLRNLSLLNLAGNAIPSLSQKTCDQLDYLAQRQHVTVDLSGNPLECQCDDLQFLRWLSMTDVNIKNLQQYGCDIHGRHVDFKNLTGIVHDMTITCSSTVWVKVTGISTALLVVLVFVSVALYRHRWDIKYFCLRLVRNRKLDQSACRTYDFDAFVAYHQDDLSWVARMLMPNLEECANPLVLCVHHRNWIPGPTIEENISRSIEVSRKTLVILSKSFLRSGWCELEMQLARMRGLEEGEEVIVVVALEEITLKEMSSTLVNLRRTNTWLDWYEYQDDHDQFWSLLRQALGDPRLLSSSLQVPTDSISTHSGDRLLD